jgi:hypothetical protein
MLKKNNKQHGYSELCCLCTSFYGYHYLKTNAGHGKKSNRGLSPTSMILASSIVRMGFGMPSVVVKVAIAQ